MKYDIIIVGSGPGGYVTAIRASQLGFKTAIVEKESLGGVCLNWGCIPTKALLKSAQVYDYLKHVDQYGLKAESIDKDFTAVVTRSRNIANGMSKGVQFLMKKNKVTFVKFILIYLATSTFICVISAWWMCEGGNNLLLKNYGITDYTHVMYPKIYALKWINTI